MASEPPLDCPGGPAVEHDYEHHLAQCRCGVWFDTVMDEPTFSPHTITTDLAVRFGTVPPWTNPPHPKPTRSRRAGPS